MAQVVQALACVCVCVCAGTLIGCHCDPLTESCELFITLGLADHNPATLVSAEMANVVHNAKLWHLVGLSFES